MKKITILSILLLLSLFSLYSQQNSQDTVTKLKMEQELSERIENVLEPYIGRCIVTVKLTMRYPTLIKALLESSKDDGYQGDSEVSRSKAAVIYQQKKSFEGEQTQILKKEVTVFVTETISENMNIFIKQNVVNLLNLNTEKGDVLAIKKILPPEITSKEKQKVPEKKAEVKKEKTSTNNIFNNFISVISLLAILAFILVFRSSITKLSTTRSNVNVTGFDKLIRLQGEMKASGMSGSTQGRQAESTSNKPLFVSIVEDKQTKEIDEALDFSYLENLSVESFIKLIANEKLEDISGVLSNLSPDFIQKFLEVYDGDIKSLMQLMLKDKQKTKSEIEMLQKKFRKKYREMLTQDQLFYDANQKMVHVINLLSPKNSAKILEIINDVDPEAANKIREQVLLLEDILSMDEDDLERIITTMNHDLLIDLLLSADDDIKQKFFKSMSARAIAIAEEDMDIHSELTDLDKEAIVFEALNKIREIMNYR